MGFKLGRFLKKTVSSVVKRAPAIGPALSLVNPALGIGFTTIAGALARPGVAAPTTGVEFASPSALLAGAAPFRFTTAEPVAQRNGGIAVPAAGAMPAVVGGLSRAVIGAILRLAAALGIAVTAGNISRVGLRLWRSVSALARRHPGVSILAFLTGLGLAADEAAEFLFWGQARARRRRGRGISARDIRTCRRTMRRMAAFQRDMFRAAPRRRAVGRGGAGPIIAQN